jgi:hypothetical protein
MATTDKQLDGTIGDTLIFNGEQCDPESWRSKFSERIELKWPDTIPNHSFFMYLNICVVIPLCYVYIQFMCSGKNTIVKNAANSIHL